MRFAIQIGFLAAALSLPLLAQHRGGAPSVSHGLPAFSTGSRPATGFTGAPATGFTGRPATGFSNAGAGFSRGSTVGHPGSGSGRNFSPDRRRGYPPVLYGGYFAPYYSSFDSSFDYAPGSFAYPPDSGEQTAEVTANLLGEQLQRLSDQVEQLSARQNSAPGPYNPSAYAPAATPNPAPEPASAVTLVLRTGQAIQVENYAVMGDSFWDFSRQPARRFPLSSLDIAASTKATEANGGQFPAL